jgi:TPR repeat protein
MGEGAVQNNQPSEDQQDRQAMRAAILSAARMLAAQDGVEGVSLSKVATQADLPRTAVYGQFARKEDLLVSIVADDLAALARSMRGLEWPIRDGGETETAVILALPRPIDEFNADERVAATPTEPMDMAKTAPGAVQAEDPAPVPRQRLPRRAELVQVLDGPVGDSEARAIDAPVREALERASRAPDAWLERRLRTFERGMAAMTTRQEQVEKNGRAAVLATEETIKSLQVTVHSLEQRANAAEQRQKSIANELRATLNETTLRLQTVEGVARAALAENHPGVEIAPIAIAAVTEPAPQAVAVVQNSQPPSSGAETPKSFLAEARKSAIAANAAAAVGAEMAAKARSKASRKGIARYLLGSLAVLVVFVTAATMAFSKGVYDGRRDALQHIIRIVPRQVAGTVSEKTLETGRAQTPLDQLTARAEAGDTAAEFRIGERYLDDTPKNPQAALHWLTLASIHGQPVAQYRLATLYREGVGTSADAAKALQWLEASALQGNRKAMHDLAIAYAEGLGTNKSPSEAARWFSRAASFGYVDSQFDLAVLYERGDGVPQSLLDAYKWYAVAGHQGDAESKARIQALRTQLDADDLSAAQRAADAFKALPYDPAANVVPRG